MSDNFVIIITVSMQLIPICALIYWGIANNKIHEYYHQIHYAMYHEKQNSFQRKRMKSAVRSVNRKNSL